MGEATSLLAQPCFICHSTENEICESLSTEELLKLWTLTGVHFSSEGLANLRGTSRVNLYRCCKCGFRFFDPTLAGNERFYLELHAQLPGYYAPDRPENERNAAFAEKEGFRTILDVGCGTGLALDAARRRGLQTFGIELSASATAEARGRGHIVFTVPIENLESQSRQKFDLISLNQVLEHVSDPAGFVTSCARWLTPRGVLAITVPHQNGILKFHPLMALNWPPHHISRWRRQDAENLARHCGMVVVRLGGNQLLGQQLERTLLENRAHYLALQRPYRGLIPAQIRLLSFIFKKTGLKYLLRRQGHSIFFYLKNKH